MIQFSIRGVLWYLNRVKKIKEINSRCLLGLKELPLLVYAKTFTLEHFSILGHMLACSQGLSLLGTDGISGASGGEISPATFNKGWKQVLQLTWLSSSVLMFLCARALRSADQLLLEQLTYKLKLTAHLSLSLKLSLRPIFFDKHIFRLSIFFRFFLFLGLLDFWLFSILRICYIL